MRSPFTGNVSGNGPDNKISLGCTILRFSLMGPINPNFSKIKINEFVFVEV